MRLSARAVAATPSVNLRAAILVVVAMSCFALNDAVVKLLAERYPPGQIMALRGVFVCILLYGVLRLRRGTSLRALFAEPFNLLRAASELIIAYAYFQALAALPLADATAVLFSFPILLTVLAALVLRERVGWRRWSAVAAGLLGVVLILRPGTEGWNSAALWALLAALAIAARDLLTRFVRPALGSEGIALTAAVFVTVGGLATLPFGWAVPSGATLLVFLLNAMLAAAAFVCIVEGTRRGDVSFTAPMRYLAVPLAFVLGWLIWGHVPDRAVLAGSLIVGGSGLFIFERERRLGRSAKPAVPTPGPAE